MTALLLLALAMKRLFRILFFVVATLELAVPTLLFLLFFPGRWAQVLKPVSSKFFSL